MLIIYLAVMAVYMIPGLVLARGMYSEQIRTIRNRPREIEPEVIVPPEPAKPKRPEIKLKEMLHVSSPRKCNLLDNNFSYTSCNCRYRDEWIRLKNAWLDYDEDKKAYDYWYANFGTMNPRAHEPRQVGRTEPAMLSIYAAVPFWPLAAAGMYVKGGAKNIPDYREIERLENNLKEIE